MKLFFRKKKDFKTEAGENLNKLINSLIEANKDKNCSEQDRIYRFNEVIKKLKELDDGIFVPTNYEGSPADRDRKR